jgi:hypothetical protein
LPIGFLRDLEVMAGGQAFSFGRAFMLGDVP